MKKGEIADQIFIYALVLVVIGLIGVFGVKSVQNLLAKQCLISKQSFSTDLGKIVYETRDIGESRLFEPKLPCSYTAICFFDRTKGGDPPYQTAFVRKLSDSNNVFIIKSLQPQGRSNVEAYNISKISLNQAYFCILSESGIVSLRLTGAGRAGTVISQN